MNSNNTENSVRANTEDDPGADTLALEAANVADDKENGDKRSHNGTRLGRIWTFVKNPAHSGAVQAIFTAIIAMLTLAYVLVSYEQWTAANDQGKTLKKTMEVQFRPWLGLERPPEFKGNSENQEFVIYTRNFGSGPALRIGTSMKATAADKFREEIGDVCRSAWELTGRGVYLFPNEPQEFRNRHVAINIGGDPTANHNLAIIGCIAYFGQLNDPHYTEFCYTTGVPSSESNGAKLTRCSDQQDAK